MRAPESIAIRIDGTESNWSAEVLAIGSPSACESAAMESALTLSPGAGVACTFNAVGFSNPGTLAGANELITAAKAAKAAEPAAIEGRIKATATAAEMKAAELATAETKAAEIVAKARAAELSAKAALTAAKASKPAAPAKKAAKAKKAVKKAGRRRK